MDRPFLKWPGGKFRLLPRLIACLPPGQRLVEPFVGSGALFLNTSFKNYLLSDTNADLILVYQILQRHSHDFIQACQALFIPKNNQAKRYYDFRKRFNTTADPLERATLFVYLNRHGYNGLCRYNQSGGFNVPFGSYAKPYFPKAEMQNFAKRSQGVIFKCSDFQDTLKNITKGDVIYCDPPYVPLSATASFTEYAQFGFSMQEQEKLAEWARTIKKIGCTVLISNHATAVTRKLYQGATITEFPVRRVISCKANARHMVQELIAVF